MHIQINSYFGENGHYTNHYSCKHGGILVTLNRAGNHGSCKHIIKLRLNLGHRVLIFASKMNLELGLQFTEI